MVQAIAYCGTPPDPATLATRFNLDPILIGALATGALVHIAWCGSRGHHGYVPLTGWLVAATALMSPLCALSVSLFSARIAQHMILLLIAAPMIAGGLPAPARTSHAVWAPTLFFLVALWAWHMPLPYDATLRSIPIYWAMHLSLFGAAVWLWRDLIGHDVRGAPAALAAGLVTSFQMSLLGAILTLGNRAWFSVHYLTTQSWGLSPLADQQLGGAIMWVPGFSLFLWVALRSARLVWRAMEERQLA
jgi:putative membrane protein